MKDETNAPGTAENEKERALPADLGDRFRQYTEAEESERRRLGRDDEWRC